MLCILHVCDCTSMCVGLPGPQYSQLHFQEQRHMETGCNARACNTRYTPEVLAQHLHSPHASNAVITF